MPYDIGNVCRAFCWLMGFIAVLAWPVDNARALELGDAPGYEARVMANVLAIRSGMEMNQRLRDTPDLTMEDFNAELDKMADLAMEIAHNPGLYPPWLVARIPYQDIGEVMNVIDTCYQQEATIPFDISFALQTNDRLGCASFAAKDIVGRGLVPDISYFVLVRPNPNTFLQTIYVLDEFGEPIVEPWVAPLFNN
jgi:hypothetical protein